MFYVSSSFLTCCLSRERSAPSTGGMILRFLPRDWPKFTVSASWSRRKTQLGVELLYMWYILFRANLVNVSRGCCKCLGRGEIFCEFETHRRAGTGNHCESASFLYTVKNEHLGWSLPTDTRCHFEEHTDLNSPHGHTAHSVAQPPIDCCS